MLKQKITKIFIAILILFSGSMFLINKNKKGKWTNMIHPRVKQITLKQIEKKNNENEKWILYIGNSFCGDCLDFRKNVLKKVLENNPNTELHYIDFVYRNEMDGDWDKIIGPKNGSEIEKPIASPSINNFIFNYTPTILVLEGSNALEVWEGFGGGPLREERYFRSDENKKVVGYQNAFDDVNKIFKKHF